MDCFIYTVLLKDLLVGLSSVAFEPRHAKTFLGVFDQVRLKSA